MIDSQAQHPTASNGPAERRRRGSGQVPSKRCPDCREPVVIDSRFIRLAGNRRVLACPACGGLVPVRVADVHRAPPPGAELEAATERPGRFGLLSRATRRSRQAGPATDAADLHSTTSSSW